VIFAFTDGDVWRPGIGDPTVMGWLTVVAYFGAALLCFREARTEKFRTTNDRKMFWSVLTVLLVFLGFNKQLDLQTLLTLTGRRISIAQGWYEYRRFVQVVFVAMIAATGFFSVWIMNRLVRKYPDLRLALVGFVALLGFVVVRAASFHHIDQLINFRLAGVKMNWVLELGAIALVSLGARKAGTRVQDGREIPPSGLAAAR